MKLIISTIVILLQIQLLHAQPPEGYYDGTENLYGSLLKHALHEIIKDHTTYPYTSSSEIDVWDILKETDKDTSNPDNVILFYTPPRSLTNPFMGQTINSTFNFSSLVYQNNDNCAIDLLILSIIILY